MNYTLVGKVQYLLGDKGYRIRDSLYTDVVTMQVEVLVGEQDAFCDWLTENTNAEVSISRGEFELIDVLV